LLWIVSQIEITVESWYATDSSYEAALYQIWGPENMNPLIEKGYAICLFSVQKSCLHSLLTTVAVDRTPD
jgi:hypothetical protein